MTRLHNRQFQLTCMEKLFNIQKDSGKLAVPGKQGILWTKKGSRMFCDWAGIRYHDKIVIEIILPAVEILGLPTPRLWYFYPQWIPPTVRVVNFQKQSSGCNLRTHMLPRALINAKFQQVRFGGSFNLYGLPPTLVVLNLSDNAFSGTANLTALPNTMKELNREGNGFRCIIVDNNSLPGGLQRIHFERNAGKVRRFVMFDNSEIIDNRISF